MVGAILPEPTINLNDLPLDGTKTYYLYKNEDGTGLITAAYSEEEIEYESQFYSGGYWFELDNVEDSNWMVKSKPYNKKVTFPKEPETRPRYGDEKYSYTDAFHNAGNVKVR